MGQMSRLSAGACWLGCRFIALILDGGDRDRIMDGRSNAFNQIDKELLWAVGLVRPNVRNLLS